MPSIGYYDYRKARRLSIVNLSCISVIDGRHACSILAIAESNAKSRIGALPLIGQVLVYGDRRTNLTVLIAWDGEELDTFAGRENRTGGGLAGREKARQAVSDHLQAVNSRLAPYEQIKRFTILLGDFTEKAGELTPTLKLRRREIVKHYGYVIDDLYSS